MSNKNDFVKGPLITIAIPCFNSAFYMEHSINSVMRQAYQNWELLLIDDGSSDTSLQIAKQYESRDSRIRVMSDGQNKGLANRLNESVREAKGLYYFRMDADDIMFPDRIQKQIAFLEAHPEIDVVGTSAVIIGENNEILFGMKGPMTAPQKRSDVINGNIFIHPSVAGKTSWFREHPYDDSKRRSQDFFLWLSSVEDSKFGIIDEPLLFYRVIDNDLWGKFKRDNRTMFRYFKSQINAHNIKEPLIQCIKQEIRLPLFYWFYQIKGSEGVLNRRYRQLNGDEKASYEAILNKILESKEI